MHTLNTSSLSENYLSLAMITQSTPKPFRVECSVVPPLYKCKLCLFHTTPDQKIYRIIKWIWIQFLDRFAFWVPIHISSVHLLADYLAPASVASISLSSVRYDTWHTLNEPLKWEFLQFITAEVYGWWDAIHKLLNVNHVNWQRIN